MIGELNKPGTLVHYRSRDWIVLPSGDADLMHIKPLGGSEEETTAVYLPLYRMPQEKVEPAHFAPPSSSQLGAFSSAKLLFDAARLSFRHASGPFRAMGKLSFRPRAYQLVPLVMALKQKVTRLLIADDVGIGKTIEALVIIKELLERGEIKRFAVICPPHLCEQWQVELKEKIDIKAEIVRSSTAAKLDRNTPQDQSVFEHLPFQVVSIDYVKSDRRKGIFLDGCPEMIILDEAHTAAKPEGAKSKNQQQRHGLIRDLVNDDQRHLLLLTATPHSGKDAEFTSLLGLLNPKFEKLDLESLTRADREALAQYFILRKRSNIKRWLEEETHFPDRDTKEQKYSLSDKYLAFYQRILQFARSISGGQAEAEQTKMLRNWAAIALIRGVMSSPAMAYEMLQNRRQKILDQDYLEDLAQESQLERSILFENLDLIDDAPRSDLMEALSLDEQKLNRIDELATEAQSLYGVADDFKLAQALRVAKHWLKEDFYPIIFCKYIPTAKYVASELKKALPKSIHIEVVTSELADEQRKECITAMGNAPKRILVATDCLSEGINLQEFFTAVLHYDLPWNPNRIEQRDGRVDRFGQAAPEIKSYVLVGIDNEMDGFVFDVLLRKVREIHKSTGVHISIGENQQNLMAEAAQKILFGKENDGKQMQMFAEEEVSAELEKARLKGENLRSIFAHENVPPDKIKRDLQEVDEAIGDLGTVEKFVVNALRFLGAECEPDNKGYKLQPRNLPGHLRDHFGKEVSIPISFQSPTPKGYQYIGRNHLFTEQLCQFMLTLAFDGHAQYSNLARVAEIQTSAVEERTTLVMFRVRNVIKEINSKDEVISEEMYLWGYRGAKEELETLDYKEAKELLTSAQSKADLSEVRQMEDIERELDHFEDLSPAFHRLAEKRAEKLVEAHGRFKELVGGRRYEKATPVLPPDVMGVYILLPEAKML